MARRDRTLKIRVSDDEHKKLLASCGDMPLAEWLRETGLQGKPAEVRRSRKPPVPPVAPELLRELVAQGQNLNQIARTINHYGIEAINQVKLLSVLTSIERELAAIREAHSRDR
jgi:hypothetical protein